MKYKLLTISILLIGVNSAFAQLNEFMIESYIYQHSSWNNINKEEVFSTLKNQYNFNTVLIEYAFQNRDSSIFYAVENAGLKSILSETSLNSYSPSFNAIKANATLNKFSSYNVIGYHIIDEPTAYTDCEATAATPNVPQKDIDSISQYIQIIKNYNNNLLRYANFHPVTYLQDNCYREQFLQKYITNSEPNILSFDHYPIFRKNLYPNYIDVEFYRSLYTFAMKSVENSIPFIYVLTPFKLYSDFHIATKPNNFEIDAKSISEFNYVIYAALVYGAKGISYWPGFQWVISANSGQPFALESSNNAFEYLSALHAKLISNSSELLYLNFISAYHVSTASTIYINENENENIYDFCLWSNFANDKYAQETFTNINKPVYNILTNQVPNTLAISFMRNQNGDIYFWLFNKSLTSPLPLIVNTKSQIHDVLNNLNYSGQSSLILLNAGEAKLFKLQKNTLPSILNTYLLQTYNSGFYKMETANNMIFVSNTFNNGSVKSFTAEKIILNNTQIKSGSTVRFKAYKNSNTININVQLAPQKNNNENFIEQISENQITLFPNPNKGVFTVSTTFDKIQFIKILNIAGQVIYQKNSVEKKEIQIDLGNIVQGVYLVQIQLKNGDLQSDKIIIK
ncbi:MAG: T9SS type A sorting domain-containing protein [Prevotellaceae bacterium]|jgi:hypothetical protein|nr:T9SS type A sorting domain-containing protein [Prevotellaceae bacterium]